MQQCCLYLQLKTNTFTLPTRFKHMMDFSLDIFNSLISNANHTYTVKSDVKTEVLQSFVDYLINDTIPDITIENINEYIDLSNEFEILSTIIEEKKSEFGEYLIHINGLRYHRNTNLNDHESQIAKQLDLYIEQYGSSLMKIPIQSLYNIFNHPSRKLTKFDAAYEEIKKEFSNSKDSTIFILLESLDGSKMTRSNLEEIISLRYERNNHMVSIDFDFISNLQQKQIESEKKIKSLEGQIEQLRLLIENKDKKLKEEKEEIKNQFEKEVHSLEIKIKQEIESKLNEHDEKLKNQIIELSKLNDKLNQEIVQFKIKENEKQSIIENIQKENSKIIENDKEKDKKILKLTEEINEIKDLIEEKKKVHVLSFPYNEGKEFSGIVDFLTKKTGGNIHDNGTIEVTSNSIKGANRQPRNLLDLDKCEPYGAETGERAATVLFDFKDMEIEITKYTIKSGYWGENSGHIKNWVIEISNDLENWTAIDEHSNSSELNGDSYIKTFKTSNQRFSRYCRFRHTGDYYGVDSNSYMGFNSIEFYGRLKTSNS